MAQERCVVQVADTMHLAMAFLQRAFRCGNLPFTRRSAESVKDILPKSIEVRIQASPNLLRQVGLGFPCILREHPDALDIIMSQTRNS